MQHRQIYYPAPAIETYRSIHKKRYGVASFAGLHRICIYILIVRINHRNLFGDLPQMILLCFRLPLDFAAKSHQLKRTTLWAKP